MYIDEQEVGFSFQNHQDLLLLGGGNYNAGKSGCYQDLETFAQKNYPQARIIAKWDTQDRMSLDGVPYIGQYAKSM